MLGRGIIGVLLLTLCLYSQDIEKEELVLEYEQALKLFNEQNYQESYKILNILFRDNLDNPEINFYLGRSSFELKKYNEAIIAYERVLFQKPNSLRVKLELGRSFLLYKSYSEAKRLFNNIKNERTASEKIIKTVNKYLDIIDSKTSKHNLNGVLIFSLRNDTNLNNRSEPHTFGTLQYTDEKERASSHQEIVVLNYKYKINDSLVNNHNILLLNRSMFNNRYKENDLRLYKWVGSLNKSYSKKFNIDYSLFADTFYQNRINTLKTYGLNPNIHYNYNKDYIHKSYIKYQKKRYQTIEDIQKNSNIKELNYELINIYSKSLINSVSATYSREKKDRGTRTDISNKNLKLSLKNIYSYKPNISFTTQFSYKESKYDDINQIYLLSTKNKLYNLGLSNTYLINNKYMIQTNLNFIKQKSNIKIEAYRKNVFAINLIRRF